MCSAVAANTHKAFHVCILVCQSHVFALIQCSPASMTNTIVLFFLCTAILLPLYGKGKNVIVLLC